MSKLYANMIEEAEKPNSPINCLDCSSSYVVPVDEIESGVEGRYIVACHCGNCGLNMELNCDSAVRYMLVEAADEGEIDLMYQVGTLDKRDEQLAFKQWVKQFTAALRAGQIFPEDFGRP